jgi:hypothetical protein
VPTRRTPGLARLDLQGGLVAQDVVGVMAERSRISIRGRCGELCDRGELEIKELVTLISTSERDEAEVVVGAAASLTFEAQRTDRAVRDRLGVRRQSRPSRDSLDPPNHVAV